MEHEARVARAAGRAPVRWRRVVGGGYTMAERWIVAFEDGSSAFAKIAVNDDTARWLRYEHAFYDRVSAPYLAELRGWDDDGEQPVLLLEDLSGAGWDHTWTRDRIDRVLETLESVRRTPPPTHLPNLERFREMLTCWQRVADDPDGFLRLGLCSREWFQRSVDALIDAESKLALEGTALVHFDVRSDNLCFD